MTARNWPSRQWAATWLASDERLELGDRVRWPLMWENEGDPRERYWHMVLGWPAERPKARPIVDVPTQLMLEVA
jgi:hypothetical protein